jgi:hypothetical protein
MVYGLIEQRTGHPLIGEPFYIGIGTSKRPFRHFALAKSAKKHPNPALQEVFEAHLATGIEPAIRIFASYETQAEAFNEERRLIALYGRIGLEPGGTLCNISAGGQGLDSETARRNSTAPKSAEAFALMIAGIRRKWDDPSFREKRSADQTAMWQDPEARTRMLRGRSAGIAQSWLDQGTRDARVAGISASASANWQDEEYAARTKAGHATAWADPEKKAARVEQMLANRPEREFTEADSARQSAVMSAVNASLTTEERSAIQTKSWEDPTVSAARKAGLKKAAQDPALKAARLANMLAGKRRKAEAAKAQSVAGS